MENLEKHILKTYHRINGVIYEMRTPRPGIVDIILVKKGKKGNRFIALTAKWKMAEEVLKHGFKAKDRVKIRFYVESNNYNGRWFTNLEVKTIDFWIKNEKKLAAANKQLKFEDESMYAAELNRNGTIRPLNPHLAG